MRILSYNINRSTQEKIDQIMLFDADVFLMRCKMKKNIVYEILLSIW